MQGTHCLLQVHLTEFDIYLCVNLLRLCLQPCRLCLHHRGGGDDTLSETEVGDTQVLVRLLRTRLSHLQFPVSFFDTEHALVDLQLYLLTDILQFEVGDGGSTLRGTYLIGDITPVPYRDAHQYTDIPHTGKLPFETVEEIRLETI